MGCRTWQEILCHYLGEIIMNGRELLEKLDRAINLDAEVFFNTTHGEFRIVDVITHYQNKGKHNGD